ncbi:SCO family protein [Wenyingzhuangia aestuarii]|uniref:SCO family protein n=1 Tax=Wenyingzhuangia aestuarii TaxID=1647582 RepID=UPI00143A9905|nr:SCO family protein [Wenyingzhuangia aestuarii]NJB82570.1 protein SCO1/2 [Wenyingzhuangia aestuarii]
MRKLKNKLIILVLVSIVACQPKKDNGSRVSKLPYYNDASFTPHWNLSDKELSEFHKVSAFSLINQEGEKITDKTFENKVYVVDFFFTTCPGICPKMTTNMKLVQQAFAKDSEVLLLSHSVTPSIDSVSVLNHYANVNEVISGKWHLATGDKKQIYNLGRQSYFIEEDLGYEQSLDDFLHTENFVLVDKNKHLRGIYNGLNKTAVKQLIADIKTLKAEVN